MKRTLLKLLILLIINLSFCQCLDAGGKNGSSPKNKVTEDISGIENFEQIILSGVANITYTQIPDEKSRVVIECPSHIYELLEITSLDNVLEIKLKQETNLSRKTRINITASSPTLRGIIVNGVGDIRLPSRVNSEEINLELRGVGKIYCKQLETTKAYLNVSGTGNINADRISCYEIHAVVSGVGNISMQGVAENAIYNNSGIGKIKADRMEAENVTATISGIGKISCHATASLNGDVGGIGNITFSGKPKSVIRNGRQKGIRQR